MSGVGERGGVRSRAGRVLQPRGSHVFNCCTMREAAQRVQPPNPSQERRSGERRNREHAGCSEQRQAGRQAAGRPPCANLAVQADAGARRGAATRPAGRQHTALCGQPTLRKLGKELSVHAPRQHDVRMLCRQGEQQELGLAKPYRPCSPASSWVEGAPCEGWDGATAGRAPRQEASGHPRAPPDTTSPPPARLFCARRCVSACRRPKKASMLSLGRRRVESG